MADVQLSGNGYKLCVNGCGRELHTENMNFPGVCSECRLGGELQLRQVGELLANGDITRDEHDARVASITKGD